MLRAVCIFAALIISGPAAAQSRSPVPSFPGQRAPVPVTRMTVPDVVSTPSIAPLTPVQRSQAIQQLTGAPSPAGQTVTLRVDAAVGPGGAYNMSFVNSWVNPVSNRAYFLNDQLESYLVLMLPNSWSSGAVLVDCAVVVPGASPILVWRQRIDGNNWIESTAPIVNNHLILATSLTGPGQRIDITSATNIQWNLQSCTMTRIG